MSVALAEIGHNGPPDPFATCKAHIDDLMIEAKNWCDGELVETQEQADVVSRLMEDFRLAHIAADNARKEENKPFDEGKAAVQEKYAPLIADTKAMKGKTVLAQEALKASLAPFLKKLDDEKRAKAEAARKEAEAAAEAAAAAMRAAQPADLEAREVAEQLVEAARLASTAASRAENDKAHARGGSRAIGLRTYYVPVLANAGAALKHYVATNPEAVKGFLLTLAQQEVQAGKRTIPGFVVNEEKRL